MRPSSTNCICVTGRRYQPAPGITTFKEAKARLFGRWQHADYAGVPHAGYWYAASKQAIVSSKP